MGLFDKKITSAELSRAATGVALLEANEEIQKRLALISNDRIKPEVRDYLPFSDRLNKWIQEWFTLYGAHFEFVDTDDFDSKDIEGTFTRHKEEFKRTSSIKIWIGASEKTIFGSEIINWYFRAWHDYTHIMSDNGYDFAGEVATCNLQQAQLPEDWHFERQLLNSEIVGQALHNLKYGEFVEDQRAFTLEFLKTGSV